MAAPGVFVLMGPQRVRAVDLLRGDKWDAEEFGQSEETDRTLKHVGLVMPLTRETYHQAIAGRPAGTVGRGFTIEGLLEWGIIDEAEAEHLAELRAGGEPYRGYRIFRVKVGIGARIEVRDDAGHLIRPARFLNEANAKAFIDKFVEDRDGVHVQSSALEPA